MLSLNNETYFTYQEVSSILGCKRNYVRDLVTQKKLESVRITTGASKHISLTNLLSYINDSSLSEIAKDATRHKILMLVNKPLDATKDDIKVAFDGIDLMSRNAETLYTQLTDKQRELTNIVVVDDILKGMDENMQKYVKDFALERFGKMPYITQKGILEDNSTDNQEKE